MRSPGSNEQGVWEEMNKVLVSGRTEMRGKVIGDRPGRPGRPWKGV